MTAETCTLSTALSIFEDHLPDIRKACVLNIQALESTPHAPWDVDTPATVEAIRLHATWLQVAEATRPMRTVIRRIDGRKKHYSGGITDAMIEAAKSYPITDLVDTPIKGGMTRCPFHDDKTASLSLRRYNRYRCFGCDERGSVIDFYMKVNNVKFIDAVKALNG